MRHHLARGYAPFQTAVARNLLSRPSHDDLVSCWKWTLSLLEGEDYQNAQKPLEPEINHRRFVSMMILPLVGSWHYRTVDGCKLTRWSCKWVPPPLASKLEDHFEVSRSRVPNVGSSEWTAPYWFVALVFRSNRSLCDTGLDFRSVTRVQHPIDWTSYHLPYRVMNDSYDPPICPIE